MKMNKEVNSSEGQISSDNCSEYGIICDFDAEIKKKSNLGHILRKAAFSIESEVTKNSSTQPKFTSELGAFISCMGCVVGTGNIWRFPRICALCSSSDGSLVFLIIWFLYLYMWSSPIILIEYTLGRFARCSPLMAFIKFLGIKNFFFGGWIVCNTIFITFFYSVVVGWTLFYSFNMIIINNLPTDEIESKRMFEDFVLKSYWPILCHLAVMILVGFCIFGGIKYVELTNILLVPTLLLILVFIFFWSLTRNYSDVGIRFLFTPNWSSFYDPNIWVAALTQNAFDTGAGMGLFATYASFFTRKTPAVQYGITIPFFNNIVSIVCGISIFGTVFSTMITDNPTITKSSIIRFMQDSGPASTGLTFTWIPVLFAKVGIMGRILCPLFFFCLFFAGLTSTISNVQMIALSFKDLGLSYKASRAVTIILSFVCGLPSAIWIEFLTNQDYVWSGALIISGGTFSILVIDYGVENYRKIIVNDFGIGDWHLPIVWSFIIKTLIPILTIGLTIWNVVAGIYTDSTWYIPKSESLISMLIAWFGLVVVLIFLTIFFKKRDHIFKKVMKKRGYDPSRINYVQKHVIIGHHKLDFTNDPKQNNLKNEDNSF